MNCVFEFDQAISDANLAKHGIDFVESQNLWKDQELFTFDAAFQNEQRKGAVGLIKAKFWTAIFTWREGAIRLISVRRSRLSEVELYEKNIG
jgi:uncharacterized protein